MIEVKYADSEIHSPLLCFHNKHRLPAMQIVKELKRERIEKGVEIVQAENYLQSLSL